MRNTLNFMTKWAFSKEAASRPETMPENWYWVNLPHTWNAIDGMDGGSDYYRGTCWYAKEIAKEDLPAGDRYYLEFEGANASADVYVNGQLLCHHDGGYSTFRVDMTDALAASNLICVAVDNSVNDRVYPQQADFTFYGGLYRPVRIVAVPEAHFDLDYYGGSGLSVTPEVDGADAAVRVDTWFTAAAAGCDVAVQITDADGSCVAAARKTIEAGQTAAAMDLRIADVHLWNGRKDPYLYTVTACLLDPAADEDAQPVDAVCTRVGVRTFEITPDKGFFLNGEYYPLHGVSRHQDRWGMGNAITDAEHIEDMDMICELGATTIRLAHYQHSQTFYDLCDERGMVVWAEIPYISRHMPDGRENTISQMKELVTQNYNHPSIVVWGLSNEITMVGGSSDDLLENHQILNDLVHKMDPTRKTVMACVGACDIHEPIVQIPDAISYNLYLGWYEGSMEDNGVWFDRFHETFPQIPYGLSEYGADSFNWHGTEVRRGDYTEEYQALYHESLIRQISARPWMWATHVWNMFDFAADARNEGGMKGQNGKGLVTIDRKYKKDAFYAYKAWLSDEPFVHVCGHRYPDRVEDEVEIKVYTNQPSVTLYVNGEKFAENSTEDLFFHFKVPNTGAPGTEMTICAEAAGCTDEIVIRKVAEFNKDYIVKGPGVVLSWQEITERDGYFCLNDLVGDILKAPGGMEALGGLLSMMKPPAGAQGAGEDGEADDGMQDMLMKMTVMRLFTIASMVAKVKITREMMLSVNEKLNQVPKGE